MIFKETWQQVLDGTKTQTRRPVKEGDHWVGHPMNAVRRRKDQWTSRTIWWQGETYAVQPGRGKKAVGRIRITKIRRERLQEISNRDIRAEGIRIEDPGVIIGRLAFRDLWNSFYRKPYRWEDNPEVWVLEFERVGQP